MAQIETSSRGRNSNVDLNLVPFIDLMSVLITFLLISAVWTQVSMIQLGASFASPKSDDPKPFQSPPLEELVLQLDVMANGFVLKVGTLVKSISKVQNSYDTEALLAELKQIKKTYPDKPGLKISISDEILYENVVSVMDASLKAGFAPEILTGGPL